MSTTEEPRPHHLNEGIPPNAVSVYGQTDAMDDFPVLKAFQQYIDAEQTKSRKRMIMLCIFFGCLMAVVIAVFIVMLHSVSERNQTLNDRFLEYMMQERNRASTTQQQSAAAPVSAASNPATDAALKAMTESISSLQKELAEQKSAAAPKEVTPQPTAKSAHEQELETLAAKHALLEAERKKIAEEKELIHQQEVERQRRRMYPDYYNDTAKPTTPSSARSKSAAPRSRITQDDVSQQDIDDIIAEAYGDDQTEEDVTEAPPPKKAAKKVAPAKKPTAKKVSAKTSDAKPSQQKKDSIKDTVESDDDAIEYFNDEEYTIPVEVKGTSSGWKVPLN